MTARQEAPDMPQPLRVLFVEDSEADTRLLLRELQHGTTAPRVHGQWKGST